MLLIKNFAGRIIVSFHLNQDIPESSNGQR